ncbi:MAG: hypothetical protein PQJ61_17135 [Spirochaetales bacterium]|uniref:Porin domain-containing protein n=1 Tax=Candidatus Thalassospirochaeta sargassi TaxID=3119039 RepID=A0AAJ1II15_9SPIO|nr:hypothetical protein [Spirochaetales bacterium]
MKKSLIVLAVLLLVGGFVFAEAGVSGEFTLGASDVFTTDASTSVINAEINITADVDEYTSVAVELDSEGDDWTDQNVALDDFRLSSNILGALGVEEVSLDLTVGLFTSYFSNWNYVSRSGEEFYYSTASGVIFTSAETTDLAFSLDLGYKGYDVMYWMDMYASEMAAAISGTPVEGANFLVGYAASIADMTAGGIWVEGGYEFEAGPASLLIPASFVYDLASESYGWSSGIAVDVDAYHFSTAVGGSTDKSAFADCLIELSTSVVENADIYVIADMDFSADSAFQSVDLGGMYNFGAFGLGAGYVLASADDVETIILSDSSSMNGSGIYLCADVDF